MSEYLFCFAVRNGILTSLSGVRTVIVPPKEIKFMETLLQSCPDQ